MKSKLGSGARFDACVARVEGYADDPEALCAEIGRRKYGEERFAQLAAAGRRKGAHHFGAEAVVLRALSDKLKEQAATLSSAAEAFDEAEAMAAETETATDMAALKQELASLRDQIAGLKNRG